MNEAPLILGINRTQDASVYKARLPGLDQPIDILVECYSSDAEHNKLAAYERELADTLRLAPGVVRAHISHHLAHAYSAFHPSPFERAAASVPGHWCEVASFYHADRDQLSCIDKQVWNRDEQRLVGLGMFYFLLTQAIFPGHGNEGKVMGLAPHGNPSALGLPPLHVEDWQVSMANWLHRETGADALCFAGGTALGCAIYSLTKLAGLPCAYRWRNDYLGPDIAEADIDQALAAGRARALRTGTPASSAGSTATATHPSSAPTSTCTPIHSCAAATVCC